MRIFLEIGYYFIGFFAADVIIRLVTGDGFDFADSLVSTLIFMCVYVVLMLGWRLINRKYEKSKGE